MRGLPYLSQLDSSSRFNKKGEKEEAVEYYAYFVNTVKNIYLKI